MIVIKACYLTIIWHWDDTGRGKAGRDLRISHKKLNISANTSASWSTQALMMKSGTLSQPVAFHGFTLRKANLVSRFEDQNREMINEFVVEPRDRETIMESGVRVRSKGRAKNQGWRGNWVRWMDGEWREEIDYVLWAYERGSLEVSKIIYLHWIAASAWDIFTEQQDENVIVLRMPGVRVLCFALSTVREWLGKSY